MTLRLLVIADPLDELKPGKESTLALILEAQKRGYDVDYCTQEDLFHKNCNVLAEVRSMKLTGNYDDYFDMGEAKIKNLARNYDTILLRSNPGGLKRIETSYMLDPIADSVLITNDPRGIREMHGKTFLSNFPDYIVPYAIVKKESHFADFLSRHNDVIVKPLDGYGGKGVKRIKDHKGPVSELFAELEQSYKGERFIVQEFIPDAVKGDKRIIMFDGQPVCALLRVPKDADSLANVTQGATVEKAELTLREKALCEEIGPILQDYGLFFVGLDMLGDYLSEINLISVGTIVPANALYDIKLEETFLDMLEDKLKSFKQQAA